MRRTLGYVICVITLCFGNRVPMVCAAAANEKPVQVPERRAARRRGAERGLDRPRRMGAGEVAKVLRGDGLGTANLGKLGGPLTKSAVMH
jgi:hypothetical protein